MEQLISRSFWLVGAMDEDAVTGQATLRSTRSTLSVGQQRSLRTVARPELFRGVPLHVALSNWGQHWRAPDQGMFNVDPKNYQLSRPTKGYDAFLSHEWASSRWLKFLSLLMIFNSGPAFAISFLVSVLVGTLRAYRVIPDQAWTLSVVYAVYFTVFLFWQHIRAIFCRPLVVFLDKLCVAQHDEELKQEGIQSLGAFLLSSRELVVLLSPQYLSLGQCEGSLSRLSLLLLFGPHIPKRSLYRVPFSLSWSRDPEWWCNGVQPLLLCMHRLTSYNESNESSGTQVTPLVRFRNLSICA